MSCLLESPQTPPRVFTHHFRLNTHVAARMQAFEDCEALLDSFDGDSHVHIGIGNTYMWKNLDGDGFRPFIGPCIPYICVGGG